MVRKQEEPASHILVVEDDPVLVRLLATRLQQEGWTVEQASTCAEACSLARLHAPELLLLDINLPDGDGWTLLSGLRRASLLPQEARVLVISAYAVTRNQLRQHEVDTFLPKPFSIQNLVAAVQALIGSSSLRTWTE